MSVIGSNIIAGASGTVETGYQIARSLRFNSADSASLSRTPGSAGNQQKWTWSGWVKRSKLGTGQYIFSAASSSPNNQTNIGFTSGDVFTFDNYNGSTNNASLVSSAVYRDVSAWYHVVCAVDTTQATASNRIKIYINGVQITAFSTSTYYPQNDNTYVNSTKAHSIGCVAAFGTSLSDIMLADVRLIDGQQLDATSFGETDSATGVWVPKAYTGTYGTNGFWLKFDDNSGTTSTTLGKDSSGNSNNWTPNNFSVTAGAGNDSLVDSPTNYGTDTGAGGEVRGNYATLNPLSYNGTSPVLSNGNLDFKASSAAYSSCVATMGIPSSGKWYWEVAVTTITTAGNNQEIAIGKYPIVATNNMTLACKLGVTYTTLKYYYETPSVTPTDNNAGLATPAQGDIMQIAYDAATGKLWMGVNNTWIGSGNPATGANPLYTYSDPANLFPFQVMYNTTGLSSTNFGQRPFAYTAPSGFKALCSTNLPTPAIGASASTLADDYFNVVTYTGTGSSLSITGVGFQPDLVWIKGRSGATDHALYDAVRGVQKQLESNTTTDETTESTGLTAFGTDGFTVGALAQLNTSAATYVGWNWKESATSGFDIVTYTGNGANRTIAHNLGVAPNMLIVKARTTAGTDTGWPVWHTGIANTNYLELHATTASTSGTTYWNSTSPTSSVFSVGTAAAVNTNNDTYVAYLFAEVTGFSKIGTYTGNGSTDGPFVFLGLRARWILVKRTDVARDWVLIDTARAPYNLVSPQLFPNSSAAEDTTVQPADILSNGFKLRTTDASWNASGGTYIFMAFAEFPFQYARAR